MKGTLTGAGALLALVTAICLVRVAQLPDPAPPGAAAPPLELDPAGPVQRLAGALRIPTVSYGEPERNDPAAGAAFARYLQDQFPRAHAALTRESVGGGSLLYTWPGRDPQALPLLLLAHLDVVPIEPGTEGQWTHPPFAGVVADGFVWGRGARDDKSSVLALMETAEWLLAHDFRPVRTVYLAFGHDEEIGGRDGAREIARLLQSRGIRADLLDEGGAVLEGLVPGVRRPVAAIMAAEKGYYTVKLSTRGEGGHSSRPPPATAVSRLARAVARVQQQQLPTHLVRPVTDMFDRLAPEMAFADRLVLANRWLFGPLIRRRMAADPTTSTLVRTTTAATVFQAGVKDNVLPSEAWALVNFRLLPGDTIPELLAHVRQAVADDGVALEEYGGFGIEASPVSPGDGDFFRLLERTARETFPLAVVSTGLVTGATDARHYEGVYATRYNFSPSVLTAADLPTLHGTDERIGVDNYMGMIGFYVRLLGNAG